MTCCTPALFKGCLKWALDVVHEPSCNNFLHIFAHYLLFCLWGLAGCRLSSSFVASCHISRCGWSATDCNLLQFCLDFSSGAVRCGQRHRLLLAFIFFREASSSFLVKCWRVSFFAVVEPSAFLTFFYPAICLDDVRVAGLHIANIEGCWLLPNGDAGYAVVHENFRLVLGLSNIANFSDQA